MCVLSFSSDYIDVAPDIVVSAVGTPRLDDIVVCPGVDEPALVASVPSLRGIGERCELDAPPVEDVAFKLNDGAVADLPFVVDPLGVAGRECVGA